MSETLYRSAAGLELRSSGDGRTIEGIAVPYGVPQMIDEHLTEMFEAGAFADQLMTAHRAAAPGRPPNYRVHLSREHHKLGGAVIGKAVELREDASGLYTALRVAKTPAGDEALELAREGVLDELSVGFRALPGGSRRRGDGIVVRHRAGLFEVALVMQGAYGREAVVTGVRSAAEDADAQARARADAHALDLALL
ncbi:HK97 family phage prohead protease [Pseudonocardia pini]|uniref:HK97 family phage prohead protease n=1 Tax=Pseudonocardia pini TaxID=2758030 RepID=UPI0015F01CB5|nr:HK97 family phage prohead protease [Pseudonocardia pini]